VTLTHGEVLSLLADARGACARAIRELNAVDERDLALAHNAICNVLDREDGDPPWERLDLACAECRTLGHDPLVLDAEGRCPACQPIERTRAWVVVHSHGSYHDDAAVVVSCATRDLALAEALASAERERAEYEGEEVRPLGRDDEVYGFTVGFDNWTLHEREHVR
jgi:hypothetical protein